MGTEHVSIRFMVRWVIPAAAGALAATAGSGP